MRPSCLASSQEGNTSCQIAMPKVKENNKCNGRDIKHLKAPPLSPIGDS